MADITMCNDADCPKSRTCYRFGATPCRHMQAYFTESPRKNDDCECYWPYEPAED